MVPFSMTLNDPKPIDFNFSRSCHFDAEYLRNGTRYRHGYNENTNRDLHMPLLNGVISNDFQRT